MESKACTFADFETQAFKGQKNGAEEFCAEHGRLRQSLVSRGRWQKTKEVLHILVLGADSVPALKPLQLMSSNALRSVTAVEIEDQKTSWSL